LSGLLLGAIQERVALIMSKTAELAALRKTVEDRTAANRKAASSIRLEKARRVVDATTEAVATMVDLRNEINRNSSEDGDMAVLAKQSC
jgi:hypothetical protein